MSTAKGLLFVKRP